MRDRLFIFVCTLVFLALASSVGAAEVIDRIVATVNGHIILQSDWEDSLRYEAFSSGRPLDRLTADDRKAALDHLIDQELLREQLRSRISSTPPRKKWRSASLKFASSIPTAKTNSAGGRCSRRYRLSEEDLKSRVAAQLT